MSLSSSIGLTALFLVDLVDIYFLSLLGEVELASAVGYAGSILFFTTSVCIGLSIATGALVSRSLGAENLPKARRYLVNVYVITAILTSAIALIIWLNIPLLISLLGAKARTAELAIAYLQIMIPSMPVLGIAINSIAALRAVGDARQSMMATLVGGAVNAVFDPILIFTFDMGVEGAAFASVSARVSILFVALFPLWKRHNLFTAFNWKQLVPDLKDFFTIAIPAIITNTATPIGTAYVTMVMATFGDNAVAGMSIVARVTPVAFGVVYALSGAVGPIIGQNYGANNLGRVKKVIMDAQLFLTVYVTGISIILFFIPGQISRVFGMEDQGADIILVFCRYIAITFIFSGATFVGNAAFNNLGRPNYSTFINIGKATIGTIPFVYFGGQWMGASGVILGQALGSVVFGVITILWVLILLKNLEQVPKDLDDGSKAEEKERRQTYREHGHRTKFSL